MSASKFTGSIYYHIGSKVATQPEEKELEPASVPTQESPPHIDRMTFSAPYNQSHACKPQGPQPGSILYEIHDLSLGHDLDCCTECIIQESSYTAHRMELTAQQQR